MTPERIPFASLSKGDSLRPFPLTIDRDDVAAYLDATGETAGYWSKLVPPLMLIARMLGGLMQAVEVPARLMHTSQEHQMHRPARIGETLEVHFTVAASGERRGVLFATFDAEVFDGEGAVVATSRTGVMAPNAEESEGASAGRGDAG